jgi:altronate dehydratase large subunit
MFTFRGYTRPDGSVGIRNRLLVIGVDECVDGVCRALAEGHDAAVLTNHHTCMYAGNEEIVLNMVGVGKNPNVGAVIVVAMGCGSIAPGHVASEIAASGKPVEVLNVIGGGGTRRSIADGRQTAQAMAAKLKSQQRREAPISKLVVGVKCGGSDASSGLASNPVAGSGVDWVVEQGGTAVGGEIIELVGGEKYMLERCVSDEVRRKLDRLIRAEEARWSVSGVETEIMSVGNSVGGITTIEEKTLGALYKYGSHQIQDVLEFNKNKMECPTGPGLYLSESSHLCGAAGTHFAAMGCQLVLWTSGGAGYDTSLVPVVRISGNPKLFNEDQDIDARGIMNGTATHAEVAGALVNKILRVADGEPTNIEGVGYSYSSIYQKDQRLEHYLRSCGKF